MNVPIRCICPPKNGEVRHAQGDTVTLGDKLNFRTAHGIRWAIAFLQAQDPQTGTAETMAVLSEQYLLSGIEAWSLRDDRGVIPVSSGAIRTYLLAELDVASFLADKADDLYGPVMLPLLRAASTSSQSTPTDESTSPPTTSSEKPPRRSKRSSITTIRTADTETTSKSLDGDSNLSPSSVSAA